MGAGERAGRQQVVKAGEAVEEMKVAFAQQFGQVGDVMQAQAKAHDKLREEFDDLEEVVVTKEEFEKLEEDIEELERDCQDFVTESDVDVVVSDHLREVVQQFNELRRMTFGQRFAWLLFGRLPG